MKRPQAIEKSRGEIGILLIYRNNFLKKDIRVSLLRAQIESLYAHLEG